MHTCWSICIVHKAWASLNVTVDEKVRVTQYESMEFDQLTGDLALHWPSLSRSSHTICSCHMVDLAPQPVLSRNFWMPAWLDMNTSTHNN